MSSSRAKKFALAQDLIENQAQVVKICVKIGDFDHWCIEASELVDLVIDLVRRDEKYLRQDGMSTRDESLHRISNLNFKFVNLVCFSVFELARKRLSPPSRPNGRESIDISISTPIASRDDISLLRGGPTPGAEPTLSSAQPPPTAIDQPAAMRQPRSYQESDTEYECQRRPPKLAAQKQLLPHVGAILTERFQQTMSMYLRGIL